MSARLATKISSRAFHARPDNPSPSRKRAVAVILRNSSLTDPDSIENRSDPSTGSMAQYEPYTHPNASRTVSMAVITASSAEVARPSASMILKMARAFELASSSWER